MRVVLSIAAMMVAALLAAIIAGRAAWRIATASTVDRLASIATVYSIPAVIACSEHGDRSGIRIPLFCEVAWVGDGGPEPYWRGRISDIDYVFQQ